jgi:CRP/FNR family transcriptional regulator
MHAISLAHVRATRAALPPATCHNCSARTRCLGGGEEGASLERLEHSVARRLPLQRHERLFHRDESCFQLYAVREGQLKTQRRAPNGICQVLGFYLPGEVLGLDALGSGQYGCDAVALTDSVVCVLPYPALTRQLSEDVVLLQQFHRMMGTEIARRQGSMVLLGNARAQQRLASFLLEQAACSQARGETPCSFQLRMPREDIAAYLGLTVESISRLLSALRRVGALRVSNRMVEVLKPELLQQMAARADAAHDSG